MGFPHRKSENLKKINAFIEEYENRFALINSNEFDENIYKNSFEKELQQQLIEQAEGYKVFAVESLPGQFDQRADSAGQCIQLMTQGERPLVRTAKVYLLSGDLSAEEIEKIMSKEKHKKAI